MATLIRSDLEFILQQIAIAEAHANGADLASLVPNAFVPFGLRTVDGTYNNIVTGQSAFGQADQDFPRLLDPFFRTADFGTSYDQDTGLVIDSEPRTISNLIVDQTADNPAAYAAAYDPGANGVLDFGDPLSDDVLKDGVSIVQSPGLDGIFGNDDDVDVFFFANTTPDAGLSAGFNSWFTLFGQFFDHGLDLVNKGGSGTVMVPLQPDDPLFDAGPDGIALDDPLTTEVDESADNGPNVMFLTRATNDPGPDGILGTSDDIHEHNNQTTPFVDQNQTYTSHPAHQVFLREYELNALGNPVATGKMLDGTSAEGLPTWADVKANALMLGILLQDSDILNIPLIVTDQYGKFIPGENGFAQVVVRTDNGADGIPGTDDDIHTTIEGVAGGLDINDPLVMGGTTVRINHAFLDDIAHAANPAGGKTADTDAELGLANADASSTATNFDNELLDRHFVTGDGRGNENIGLTAVHHVFHAEHNRQVDEIKATVLASGDPAFIAQWQLPDGSWNGERLFQAARFATEMQYQHLVFEEFARKVQPNIDAFLMYDATINPAIVAEFAHVVYRFGHSMLTETIDRYDPNFNVIGNPNGLDPDGQQMGLIAAFLNPLAFTQADAAGVDQLTASEAAGAIVRGMTRQAGNEIDEFVTEALRNNLVGLPLDLATINLTRGRDAGVPSLNAARRDFYENTGDSQLRPYTSWADFAAHLKHPESIVNFVAAYGTHAAITSATTLADKRLAATLLVFGDGDDSDGFTIGATNYTDRVDFLNSTGAYANLANGVTITGLDDVDLWIGGLAEKQMPFGGLLGSTFNFVFETQLENLQNGDRFYYLGRLQGMNFLTELENNSFSKLIMLNTDVTRLPADVFSTPTWILEVDTTKQFNDSDGDGVLDSGDPLDGTVIRDNPATPGLDTNYLQYTGPDHVVLGGTPGDDIMIASIGDDTLWGDAGNDRLEGGDGVDTIEGGAGDDIITDIGGDDVLKGNDGNDVIHGGNGFNLILGGFGKDFIITGEDVSETFAGPGDDFILGAKTNLPTIGNEGNDWIELGTQDGAPGDNFDDILARDTVRGHDIFIGGGGFDEMLGEGGDDIFVGSEGEDHFDGSSGFDWTTYKNDTLGVSVDLMVNDFVEPPANPSNAGILDRFAFVEGLSGSAGADILRGDNQEADDFPTAGPQGSVLMQDGIDLIGGLQSLLGAGVNTFSGGNILLGGDGSDIIEGRAGNDIVDGDRWLNVRISIRAGIDAEGNASGAEIATADGMSAIVSSANPALNGKTLVELMLSGTLNPGQLVATREILSSAGPDFDTAVFSGLRADYTIVTGADGTTVVSDNRIVGPGVAITDGVDTLRNIERLQFSDQQVVLSNAIGNDAPVGLLEINDTTPSINQLLSVSIAGVTDADNPGTVTGPVTYYWQVELIPGSGVFQDIVLEAGGAPSLSQGPTFRVTPDLDGLAIRARAVYKDANGTLENVYSAPTAAVAGTIPVTPTAPLPPEGQTVSAGNGVHFIRSDLQLILDQIKIAERHAAGESLTDILPNSRVAFGLRTVDGSFNNLIPGQEGFGAADENFPLLLDQVFRNEGDDVISVDFDGPGGAPAILIANNNYATSGPGANVADADPRLISNLIVDQTANNPAAVEANGGADPVLSPGLDGVFGTADDTPVFFIGNTAPDEGLSAPFNAWMTFFGQFFDHGLDLVNKGGSGVVFIPLQPDDPLYNPLSPTNFMMLTRATNTVTLPGADGIFNNADDVHLHNNQTTPFVDQNQTYTSHPSHQVFLREYELDAGGRPVNTGKLLEGDNGGLATWADVKEQALNMLGIALDDADVLDLPMVRVDAYGNFIPDSVTGFAQIILDDGADNIPNTSDDVVASGTPLAPVDASLALRTHHAFLDDIAHSANPSGGKTEDSDATVGNAVGPTEYDGELLDAHYITGDGRGNENIGLTAVHFVFHAEHNRLVDHIKDVVIASNDLDFVNEWLLTPVATLPTSPAGLDWDGSRLFQAARFGTEMQYQHLVFEEFARKVQPQVDVFFAATQVYDTAINPAILAEFAHVVYRFGHSMLTETIDRFDPNFNVIDADPLHPAQDASDAQIGLIAAFLNPLAFAASGATQADAAGAIVRGVTRQAGNEIDEFVTEALRNNLVGLPLDLAAINLARGRDAGVPSLNQARSEFFAMTGDTQLKPYASWNEFGQSLKHAASLVNFIAAYGTHASIAGATTLLDKRAAAYALVYGEGGLDGDVLTTADNPTVAVPADRLAFLNGPSASTGLDTVDLWIGGLAEKTMPFGGLLGSTFNFVFESQMEKLQDGDRFYYLERTAGMNFLTELENNSFAKLIMANTDATHLPGDVFANPTWILEVDQTKQFNPGVIPGPDGILEDDPSTPLVDESADNLQAFDDPVGDPGVVPLVVRNGPNSLEYNGPDHVVLGGTPNDDTIISSEGDDTVYGDEGNDRLEGGDGNDFVLGGAGDDIITDQGGDDNLQGQDGDDAIHGGNGINLILGGFGNDFIVTGPDSSEAFGGVGNDFILGVRANEVVRGNEGDDWIEGGMVDGEAGDNFDPFARDLVIGNDVFIGDPVTDRMDGEGGDDIMVGNGGIGDRYEGFSGFDWASFKDELVGVTADLTLRAFDETPIPVSQASIQARFVSVEGLSGSSHNDFLRGDDRNAALLAPGGAVEEPNGSVLTNIGLINGLQSFLDIMIGDDLNPVPVTSFDGGNIILGGAGSDIIEGRGGDDLIDGDLWLNVRIGGVDINGVSIGDDVKSMRDIQDRVFAGEINPGDLFIVREILTSPTTDFDTVMFSGALNDGAGGLNYDITFNLDGTITVTDLVGLDGTDTLRNIERLQFTDVSISNDPLANFEPFGAPTIDDDTPTEDQLLTVDALGVFDPNNITEDNPTGAIEGPIAFFWQQETSPGVWVDIINETGEETSPVEGPTFTPRDGQVGFALRVRAVYQDAIGVLETVFSAPTALVTNVNDAPVGNVAVSDATPTETQAVVAINQFTDSDGLIGVVYTYQWQQSDLGGGGIFTDIAGATGASFTPGPDQVNRQLRVVVTYTDNQGTVETVISQPTVVTGDFFVGSNDPLAPDNWTGTEGQDIASGLAGNDLLNSLGEDDIVDGGAGNDIINAGSGNDNVLGGTGSDTVNAGDGDDIINGGIGDDNLNGDAGNDTFSYVMGQGVDNVDGGLGIDTLNITGTNGNDTLDVVLTAGVITAVEGGLVTGIESVTADLGAGTDRISYGATTENLTIDLGLGTGAPGFLSIANVENATGGQGNDVMIGGAGANALDGSGGNDRFVAMLNDGNDAYSGGAGVDTYDLSGMTDGATVTATSSTSAQTGTDTLASVENIIGTQGNDSISLNGAVNVIDGGVGDDTISGGGANDTISGGVGNDVINYTFGDGSDAVDGGDDTDTLNIIGTAAANTLDIVFDGVRITQFEGGTVNNVELVNADLLGGVDTLSYAATLAANAVTVDLGLSSASGFNTIAGIENVTGGAGNDSLTGDGANNSLSGGGGNDTLSGGLGNDVLSGGAGIDTASYANETDAMFVSLLAGNARRGTAANPIEDTLTTIENVTGGAGNDSLTGNTAVNILDGGAGDDTIAGGTGNDNLLGGAGNDAINYLFGDGADTVDGGADTDTLTITGTGAANTLDVILNGGVLTNFEGGTIANVESVIANLLGGTDTLTYNGTVVGNSVTVNLTTGEASGFTSIAGIENVVGGAGDDSLTGSAGVNNLNGGAGNDFLDGGASNDTLVGGAGNDTYFANNGDILTEAAGGGIDSVFTTSTTFTLAANVENLTFIGGASFTGNGNGSDNTITGGVGSDTLNGAGGADTLIGGLGNDNMNGGAQNDTFIFTAGFGIDTITGFDSDPTGGQDLLNISALGVTAASFAADVSITGNAAVTTVGIAGNAIVLIGVNVATVNQTDFLLA